MVVEQLALAAAILLTFPTTDTATAFEVSRVCLDVGQTHGVPPAVCVGVAWVESGFTPAIRNDRTGACGLMQVMPRSKARPWGYPRSCEEMQQIDIGADAGGWALARWMRLTPNMARALERYNTGYIAELKPRGERYRRKVLRHVRRLRQHHLSTHNNLTNLLDPLGFGL